MGKPTPPFQEIMFFGTRMDIKDAVRNAVKKYSFDSITFTTTNDLEDILTKIELNDRSVLILDWEYGKDGIMEILVSCAKSLKIETRAILIIANSMSNELLSASVEYHVSKVHTGDISMQKIIELLEDIGKDETLNGPLRSVISQVNKKRNENDWEGASSLLKGLEEKLPNNPKVLTEIAINHINAGQIEEAITTLKPLENIDPPNLRSLHILSKCKMKLGKFEEASELLKKAKVINPHNIERLITLGNVLIECDKISEAKDIFSEAKDLDPDNPSAIQGEGKCLLVEGEINDALSLLKELESQNDFASVFNAAAILCMRKNNFDQGMDLYQTALKSIVNDDLIKAKLMFNKGIGFKRWNKIQEALDCLDKSVALDNSFEKAKKNYISIANKINATIPEHIKLNANNDSGSSMDQNEEDTDLDFSLSSSSVSDFDFNDIDDDDSIDII